jgi:hypothetical protein
MRSRGPGDTDNAMRGIERDYGIAHSILWSLRYRPERYRTIGAEIYARLQAAYAAECERQSRKLALEIEITKAIAGPNNAAVREDEALVSEKAGEKIECTLPTRRTPTTSKRRSRS